MEQINPKQLGFRREPIVKGSETIYEQSKGRDRFGFGQALVRIGRHWNERHFHSLTSEIYLVLQGYVRLNLFNPETGQESWEVLSSGQSVTITPCQAHRIHSVGFEYAWFYVFTWPPFDPEDYYPIGN